MSKNSTNPAGSKDKALTDTEIREQFGQMAAVIKEMSRSKADGDGTKAAITKAYALGKNSDINADPHISVSETPDPRGGFKSFNHFCHDVRRASVPGEQVVTKALTEWTTKAASGLNESVGSEGGFLVPPEFSAQIMQRVYDNDLLSRCQSYTVGGSSMAFPIVDETSRADGSRFGGVLGYWDAEAAQFTATKPGFGRLELALKKLLTLCYVTEELLQDSGTPLQQYLTNLYAQEIAFKIGNAIVRGTGSGMPQGILNAPSLVSVSKETGQAATTILYENIVKMWQRMWAASRQNAIWLINQDTEQQLMQLALNIGTAGTAAYLPPGGLSEKPYGTLMGRPVIPVEFCSTLGTVGDIILVDLSQFIIIRKGETQSESSIHIRFDFAETAFRTIFRADGKIWWGSALTPFQGSNTLSPAIALSTRS